MHTAKLGYEPDQIRIATASPDNHRLQSAIPRAKLLIQFYEGRILTSNDGSPHGIDTHVGLRVRKRRKELGMSQETLAVHLGLTFQQVQKYERGSNRISASKLHAIAMTLRKPIGYFYADYDDDAAPDSFVESASERSISTFLSTREGIELAELFPRVKGPKLRRRILELTKTLADDEPERS